MYKITGNDNNGREWTASEPVATKEEAVKVLVATARKAAATVPNNATVDITGPDEVSVLLGVYKVRTYRIEAA